jgi:hypothetical protein
MAYLAEGFAEPQPSRTEVLIRLTQGLLFVGKQLVKKTPARIFFDYHKAHFKILFSILRSAERAAPIKDEVRALDQNIDRLVASAQTLLFEAERLPPSPWEAVDKGIRDVPAILAPDYLRAYQQFLDAYEGTANQVAASIAALLDAATRIERETPTRLAELRAQIRKLPQKTTFDFIIKQRLEEETQFVQLALEKVIRVRGRAERAIAYVRSVQANIREARR